MVPDRSFEVTASDGSLVDSGGNGSGGGQPFVAGLSFSISQIHGINDKDLDYTISVMLKASWRDSRLVKDNCSRKLDPELLREIWKPDWFISGTKSLRYWALMMICTILGIVSLGSLADQA